MQVCSHVAGESYLMGANPITMMAIANTESFFSYATNKKSGAVGPLQVLPKYWCKRGKKKGCNLIRAGVTAYKTYRKRGTRREALCRYVSGQPCKRYASARRYASRVEASIRELEKIEIQECIGGC